jgi:RecJ-like exonuclease
MSHAELCPVCNGTGEVVDKMWQSTTARPINNGLVCHGCHGMGWVTVYDGDYKFDFSGGTRDEQSI